MRKLVVILVLLLAFSYPALAERELLPEGAYGTTIHGGLKAAETRPYVLDAQQGQVLKVHVYSKTGEKKLTLELRDSEGESVLGGLDKVSKIDALNLVLPKDDRYVLVVKAGATACTYVLEVTLEDAPTAPQEPGTSPKKPTRPGKVSEPVVPSPEQPSEHP